VYSVVELRVSKPAAKATDVTWVRGGGAQRNGRLKNASAKVHGRGGGLPG